MDCLTDKDDKILDIAIPHLECEIIKKDSAIVFKYGNGIMICEGKYKGTSGTLQTYFDQFKRTSENMKVIFPEPFIEEPRVIITPIFNSYICCVMINSISNIDFGFTGLKANLVPTSNTSVDIDYIAIGRWK